MNFEKKEKIKNELKLFFSWNQIKEDFQSAGLRIDEFINQSNISKDQKIEMKNNWKIIKDNNSRFIVRLYVLIIIFILSLSFLINIL